MNKVNLHNYEAFVLDYLEGTLSAEDTADLLLFIEENPELGIELEENNLPYIENEESLEFSNKQNLYKSEPSLTFEELCIAYFENNISDNNKIKLFDLCNSDDELQKQFNLFSKVYLNKDELIEFPFKENLKKIFAIDGSFESLAVKQVEGTISKAEAKILADMIANNKSLAQQLRAFEKTKLPAETIVFKNKSGLYKERGGISRLSIFYYAAASIAIIIALAFLFIQDEGIKQGLALRKIQQPKQVRSVQFKKATDSFASEKKYPVLIKQNFTAQNQKRKIKQSSKGIPDFENLISIEPLAAKEIESFQLPADYIALSPNDMQDLLESSSSGYTENTQYLKPGQFFKKRIAKILKKQNIDIDSPIKNIQENGLSQIGVNSLEKVTKGKVKVDLSEDDSKKKITAIEFFGLSYKRPTN